MTEVTIVYWRDMPAQVLVGRGRKAVKVALSERFEQAIDRAAMKAGMAGTDDYLSQWRKGTVEEDGPPEEAAQAAAARIESGYDTDRLKALIDNLGHA